MTGTIDTIFIENKVKHWHKLITRHKQNFLNVYKHGTIVTS